MGKVTERAARAAAGPRRSAPAAGTGGRTTRASGPAGGGPEARRPAQVRSHNTALVLGLLRTGRPYSRAELARETGLSLPTMMEIVRDLCAEGLVTPAGEGPSGGGRPPRLYEFSPGGRTAIGVSVGTRTTTGVVTDLDAAVLHEIRRPSRLHEGPDACVAQVRQVIDELLGHVSGRHGEVLGIGLAVAATVRDSDGRSLRPWSDPAWPPVPLRDLVADRYGVTVELDNYAKAVAVGEHRFGSARGHRHALCVVLQDGVGAALIVDGGLYRGLDGAAGGFGATAVYGPDGERTTLDEVAGSRGIAALAASRLPRGEPGPLTAGEVCEAAHDGDDGARRVLHDVGDVLGEAVHNACVLFAPEVVVLTGPVVAAAGEPLVGPASRAVRGDGSGPRLVTGSLGELAGAIGAVALLLRNSFIDPLRPSAA